MKNTAFLAVGLLGALSAAGSALAQDPTITSYEIHDAARSGFGGWAHVYNGTIVDTGNFTANGISFTRADYSGGSGTLNDGSPGTSPGDTELFANNSNAHPKITLHLDGNYQIDNITLYSFDSGNSIPGCIKQCSVTIDNQTEVFTTTEQTTNDEFIDLSNSPLGSIQTDTVILSDFVFDGRNNGLSELFCIGEIGMTGNSGDFRLTINGECPGTITVGWRNATPSSTLAIVFGAQLGSTTIPNGPCQGTVLGIQGQVRLVRTVNAGSGNASIDGRVGTSACGTYLQLVQAGSCDVSNPAQIP